MRILALSLGVTLFLSAPCHAADEPAEEPDPNQDLIDETARINAQAALINARAAEVAAQAELNKAKIEALGLPSYSGETTLESGAGTLEATMLATSGLYDAARQIAEAASKDLVDPRFFLLTGDESLDFDALAAMQTQLQAIRQLFHIGDVREPKPAAPAAERDPALPIAAISAVAGLLRAETTVSALDLGSINSQLLARAVAGHLKDKAIVFGEPVIPADELFNPTLVWEDQSVLQRLQTLLTMRAAAQTKRDALGDKPNDANKAAAARLDAALSRFDSFFAKVTVENDKNVVPIAHAAMLQRIAKMKPYILRVDIEKAGGSVVNTKNLATTLGVDPVKVSGGLIASYLLTDSSTGLAKASGILVCRSTLASLRRVQEADWNVRGRKGKDQLPQRCTSANPPSSQS